MEHMELVDFCGLLGMEWGSRRGVPAYAWEADAVQEAYRLLYGRPARFFHRLSAGTQVPQRSLALYVQFAQMLWPVYRQWGIPKEIYLDTFSDIALWEREYFEAHGAHGLTETEWLAHHVRMEIFRLGSLQFQPQKEPLEEVWKSAGIDGTEMVLNVHIPKGADLDTGAVRQSYVRALDFWGCGSAVLLCESWLLSPQLGELLPQKSRIPVVCKRIFRHCGGGVQPTGGGAHFRSGKSGSAGLSRERDLSPACGKTASYHRRLLAGWIRLAKNW